MAGSWQLEAANRSPPPAAFPDLRWEAGDDIAGPAGAHVERLF